MYLLKQSTAVQICFGPFVNVSDGATLETGLASDLDHPSTGIMLSKNGGALAVRDAPVTATTYDAHGCYRVTLDGTDTATLGHLRVIYTDPSTCLAVWRDYMVVTANVYDALCSGTALLDVNTKQIAGSAQSATDLRDFADAGYDPASHTIEEVKRLTGHTAQRGDTYARLGAPNGASVAADVAAVKAQTQAIEADTQDIQGTLGAAGSGLTEIPSVKAVTGAVGSVTNPVSVDDASLAALRQIGLSTALYTRKG